MLKRTVIFNLEWDAKKITYLPQIPIMLIFLFTVQAPKNWPSDRPISAMLKVPDGTFSWKWFKSLAQRSDLRSEAHGHLSS